MSEQSAPVDLRIDAKLSDTTFEMVINKDYLSKELRSQLQTANVLLIPTEGYGDRTDVVYFPGGTTDLFQFMKVNQTGGMSTDICIEDKDYKDLVLHADWLFIADLIAKVIVLPFLISLLANYITQRLGNRVNETKVRSKITIVDTSETHQIEYLYDGPASEYEKTLKNVTSSFPNLPKPATPKKAKPIGRKRRPKKR